MESRSQDLKYWHFWLATWATTAWENKNIQAEGCRISADTIHIFSPFQSPSLSVSVLLPLSRQYALTTGISLVLLISVLWCWEGGMQWRNIKMICNSPQMHSNWSNKTVLKMSGGGGTDICEWLRGVLVSICLDGVHLFIYLFSNVLTWSILFNCQAEKGSGQTQSLNSHF